MGWRILLYVGLAILLVVGLVGLSGGGLLWGPLAELVAGLVAGWIVLSLDGHGPAALGFGLRVGAAREALLGLGLGVLLLVPILVVLVATGCVAWHAEAGTPGSWLVGSMASLGVLALPAAAEEVLIRGYPLQALARSWGPGPALAATSGLFGILHLGNPEAGRLAAVNVALAGVFLGVLVLRTGSLWWAAGAHLGWNWAQGFLADLPVSGLDLVDAPLVGGRLSGPAWLSGGGFGVEGSVLTALVMAAAAWMCWRTDRLRPDAPRWWIDENDGGPTTEENTDKEWEA
jgi:membrane protease YdiL (CAAX protease family)